MALLLPKAGNTVSNRFSDSSRYSTPSFTANRHIPVDGVAGENTQSALYSENAPSQPDSGDTGASTSSSVDEKIIVTAKKYLNCKYVYTREVPPYFDCSGPAQYVFKQYGYSPLRTASQQGYINQYPKLTIGQLKMSDLVFFNTNLTDGDMCDHTGIYIRKRRFNPCRLLGWEGHHFQPQQRLL